VPACRLAGKVRNHGYSKRRTWRKLHLGCDPKTDFIHCFTLTENGTDDGSQLEQLLEQQVDTEIEDVYADGAYDIVDCWDGLMERNINPVILPRRNVVLWYLEGEEDMEDNPRNRAIQEKDKVGRKEWKVNRDYHR